LRALRDPYACATEPDGVDGRPAGAWGGPPGALPAPHAYLLGGVAAQALYRALNQADDGEALSDGPSKSS
jgi:hypothetical protein